MSVKSFFYFVDSKPMKLTKLNNIKFVSPKKNNHIIHVGARLIHSSRLSLNTNVPNNMLVVHGSPSKLEEMVHYKDIDCTRSAFVDEMGNELILTDEVLVCFKNNLSEKKRQKLCSSLKCIVIDDSEETWRIRVKSLNDEDPLNVANDLAQEKGVEFAEPNALQSSQSMSSLLPKEPLFKNQWHLNNTSQGGGIKGADVNAIETWKITEGSPKIRIVVHDKGVEINHPDLKGNIGDGKDFDTNDDDASNKNNAHGTACAGLIAASKNDNGVLGIAPKCQIIPLKAVSLPWKTWAETFEWAENKGDIISCSWGISKSNILSRAIRKAIKNGRNGKGIPCFFATGNFEMSHISYPSSLPETIAVGASTNLDTHAKYSNYGIGIDFVAPSSGGTLNVETTDNIGEFGYNKDKNGNYCKADNKSGFGGTSAATPLAAGVAGLMLSVNPNLTADEIRQILRETTDKIDTPNANYDSGGWSERCGFGRINAFNAVKEAKDRLKS